MQYDPIINSSIRSIASTASVIVPKRTAIALNSASTPHDEITLLLAGDIKVFYQYKVLHFITMQDIHISFSNLHNLFT